VADIIPELSAVQSEALQSKIRELLPSQQGFGTDLVAQNIIVPVVDLTAAAEGSAVAQNLQTAIAFGSVDAYSVRNTTSTIISGTGFYRIFGSACSAAVSAGTVGANISTKLIQAFEWNNAGGAGTGAGYLYDFIVFLRSGDSVTANSSNTACLISGTTRQIADINGTLVQPAGFSPQ
jgi:hypothetical protein